MTSASAALDLRVEGPLATLTLCRPAKLNALTPSMLGELEDAIGQCERAPAVRVVLLTAEGDRAFCVGADINEFTALEPVEVWRHWVREGHRVFDRLARIPQPTIAAVNGHAFGGGLELALAADLRLAAAHAEFAMPEVTIGTVPGWGGTRRLTALVGPARSKELILTGARINADTAASWGLVNDTTTGDVRAAAADLAAQIASNAPLSVQLAKQAIDAPDGSPTAALEAMAGALVATTDDAREGVQAFRDKRRPTYQGR